MTTRIGLVSDVHSSPAPLAEALDLFAAEGVDDIICAGDIAGYYDSVAPTVELLRAHGCRAIVGNHDQKYLSETEAEGDTPARQYLQGLPSKLELEYDDLKVLVVHANPPDEQHGGIKLLDQDGQFIDERCELWRDELAGLDADVLIVGHTHQVYARQLGDVFVVNPGSSAFNHSCMILSLPDLEVQTYALRGQDIIYCWRFSLTFGERNRF